MLRAGVCKTDLEVMKGYMGFTGTLGHEFVGEVVKARDESLVGARVCGDINVACCNKIEQVECSVCKSTLEMDKDEVANECINRRQRNHCPNRNVLGILGRPGCFSQYLCLPRRNLHVVDPRISDIEAVFAEPLAAALRIVEQNLVKVDDGQQGKGRKMSSQKIAVLGDGKLGLLITAALAATLIRSSSSCAFNQSESPFISQHLPTSSYSQN